MRTNILIIIALVVISITMIFARPGSAPQRREIPMFDLREIPMFDLRDQPMFSLREVANMLLKTRRTEDLSDLYELGYRNK
ncbi:unnamed protein product [Adineta steineri]|uniref:Uncharacterized protein n=2 Tax=Adineta steineri TaxID=433720 RepID=A0A815UJ22_9BILA|nr:unnamed protein product [Adineta steineri]CAF1520541.1 unnamed protein product [Adineta steineri]CAF4071815.1 unnamed protein product [Adineta steineri]